MFRSNPDSLNVEELLFSIFKANPDMPAYLIKRFETMYSNNYMDPIRDGVGKKIDYVLSKGELIFYSTKSETTTQVTYTDATTMKVVEGMTDADLETCMGACNPGAIIASGNHQGSYSVTAATGRRQRLKEKRVQQLTAP